MTRSAQFIVAVAFAAGLLSVSLLTGGPLTDQGTQPGLAFQLTSASVGPGNCQGCHGTDYEPTLALEPWNTWAGSMMANASRDPLFWAALDVANNDIPGVGDWCLRCHVPKGWLAGRSEPPGGTVDGCSLVGNIDAAGNDFEGVTCHLCHRMQENASPPPGQQSFYTENGQYWIDDVACPSGSEPCRRGPYDYPADGGPPPHPWAFSALHEDSMLCGTCHNVTNPVNNLIVDGVDQGIRFPIERTLAEWEHSDYSDDTGPDYKTCQNCHMPDSQASPANACRQRTNDHSGDLPVHQFAGGNSWVPEVLRLEYPNLNRDGELSDTRDAALDMLQNQSATVELIAPAVAAEGLDLAVEVKVTNLTGHKLPTGYPEGRRMWINVQARDGANDLIWESGAYDAATGVLTHDAAVKIYESEQGVWDYNGTGECDAIDSGGDPMFHFVLNNCVIQDNRIPPKGFTGAADIELRNVGYPYPETSPGSGVSVNYDVTQYAIPIPPGTSSPVNVSATLNFQTASKDYIEFLNDEALDNNFPDDCIPRSTGLPGKSRGELLYDMWNAYGKAAPVAMGSDARSAAVVAPTPGEAGAASLMLVREYDSGTGRIDLNFGEACSSTEHAVYVGDLANVSSMTFDEQFCGQGPSAGFVPSSSGSLFFLIVGQDGVNEGSYGVDSNNVERPEDVTLAGCGLPQILAARCDP